MLAESSYFLQIVRSEAGDAFQVLMIGGRHGDSGQLLVDVYAFHTRKEDVYYVFLL